MSVPEDAAVLQALQKIKEQDPKLGMPKVLKLLKEQHSSSPRPQPHSRRACSLRPLTQWTSPC